MKKYSEDWFMDYAEHALRVIELEQEWLEIQYLHLYGEEFRGRHDVQWTKDEHGRFTGSVSSGGGSAGGGKSVDNAAKNDIIEEKEVEFGVPYGAHSIDADMDYINSDDYACIFDNVSDNPAVNKTLLECARKSIEHRNGTKFEDMYFINAETGEILASQTEMKYESGISYNGEIKKLLKEAKEKSIPLVTLHNHPEGYPPSVDDLNKSYENGTIFGIAAGHNGQVYKYNNPGKLTKEADIIHQNIALLCGDGAADPDRIYKEEFRINGLSYEIVKGR